MSFLICLRENYCRIGAIYIECTCVPAPRMGADMAEKNIAEEEQYTVIAHICLRYAWPQTWHHKVPNVYFAGC
jgi:hypothetical protein